MMHLSRTESCLSTAPSRSCTSTPTGRKSATCTRYAMRGGRIGLQLLIHRTGCEGRGINPIEHGSLPRTCGRPRAEAGADLHGLDVALAGRGATRKRAAPRSVSQFPRGQSPRDPSASDRKLWAYNTRKARGERIRVSPRRTGTKLDVWPVHPSAEIPDRSRILRQGPTVERDGC